MICRWVRPLIMMSLRVEKEAESIAERSELLQNGKRKVEETRLEEVVATNAMTWSVGDLERM